VPFLRSTPAIVLRSWPYGESDKIVSFLTRDFGKIKGVAKGAKRSRKRFLNVLEPFALVGLRFHRRPNSALVFVDGCDWTHAFRSIGKELAKIAHAFYLVEISDEFTKEGDESRAIFEHLYRGLRFLENNDTSATFLTAFEMVLLRLSGYEPMLAGCRRCGARPPDLGAASTASGHSPTVQYWGFSYGDGGVLCRACSRYSKDTVPLSLAALRVLSYFRDRAWSAGTPVEFPARAIKETRQLLPLFIQFQISKRLKSVAFLEATF
jgi:DNA repair protein RecO (recombination protein O)